MAKTRDSNVAMLRPRNTTSLKARLFRALGDEARLTVLEHLADGEQRVSELAERLDMPQSSISTHLANLNTAGAVERRAEGRNAYYAFAHPALGEMLALAEEIAVAPIQRGVACLQVCCQPAPSA
jgi:DNA-binding transcriptional ArsR family regulator